jgi:hypothetical protein
LSVRTIRRSHSRQPLPEFARVAESGGEKKPVDCELLLEEALLNLDGKIKRDRR